MKQCGRWPRDWQSVVERLYSEGRFDGIMGMGGSGGTSIATAAMRTLPVGVPKLMVSTVGGGDVSIYAGSKDITFMPSVVDVAGINRLSRAIYANAAGAIAGMVQTEAAAANDERPLIAASMFGNTTAAVDHARGLLEGDGYEVLVFHATGGGGRTMEDLISDGYIAGCLDMTTTELADEICGGVYSAGPERVQAAPRQGIPTLIVPGCVDMANFGGIETVPAHYRERLLYQWNPEVTLMRTNEEEEPADGRDAGRGRQRRPVRQRGRAYPPGGRLHVGQRGGSLLESQRGPRLLRRHQRESARRHPAHRNGRQHQRPAVCRKSGCHAAGDGARKSMTPTPDPNTLFIMSIA